MIAFFDASALIYLLEGEPSFATHVQAELTALAKQHANLRIALSRLSWLECRVGPMKANDAHRLLQFDAFFAQPDLIWIELDRAVVELAAAIRAHHHLRTPDALQAACCLQLGPEHVMLTGDAAFGKVAGLHVRRIP